MTHDQNPPTPQPSYSLSKASQFAGIHPDTLRKWIQEGKVKSCKSPTGRYEIPACEVERLAAKRTQQG